MNYYEEYRHVFFDFAEAASLGFFNLLYIYLFIRRRKSTRTKHTKRKRLAHCWSQPGCGTVEGSGRKVFSVYA